MSPIISGGVELTGGLPVEGTGVRNPLKTPGVPVDNVDEVASAGTLTLDTKPTDGDTFTIGTKVYTFEDVLTDVDGNILVGANVAASKANLLAAMDLTGTPGTDYALSMTANTDVTFAAFIGDDTVLTAITAGAAGDTIATTETFTAGTNVFDAATLGTTVAGVTNVDGSYLNRIPANGFVYDIANDDLYENTGTSAKPAYGKIDA